MGEVYGSIIVTEVPANISTISAINQYTLSYIISFSFLIQHIQHIPDFLVFSLSLTTHLPSSVSRLPSPNTLQDPSNIASHVFPLLGTANFPLPAASIFPPQNCLTRIKNTQETSQLHLNYGYILSPIASQLQTKVSSQTSPLIAHHGPPSIHPLPHTFHGPAVYENSGRPSFLPGLATGHKKNICVWRW